MNFVSAVSKRFGFALGAATLIACGSTPPPKELVDARAAYQRAQEGQAAELNPAQLHVAKESLDIAEHAYEDDPSSDETRDRAYIAQRKAELAEAQAGIVAANRQKAQAQRDLQVAQGQMAAATQSQLAQTREQLAQAGQQLAVTGQQLAAERQARIEAEKRAKEAMDNLARVAAVKEEQRGTVITLSGSVLFASGQAALLPSAQDKLSQVAEALKNQGKHTMIVEGHTDSQGSEGLNQELSTRRANAVRDYLISRGIPTEQIRAVGLGSTRPVADNKTAEGRANNRRVEIVVQPAPK